MIKLLRRMGRYVTAALTGKFNEAADPKVQLEQAIIEAQEQHRRLTEQAANVIANQKQTEMRLNRAMAELEKVNGSARQALLMVDDATKRGDAVKAAQYGKAAESFANRLISVEKEVESLKQMALQTAQAADQAKAAVSQNSMALQKKLAERQQLLSKLDQAKMQEQMNRAMASLSESVGQDVPTLNEVRDKIEARYAKALGAGELRQETVESSMLEIEQAQMNVEAQGRLAELRTQLGLSSPAPAAEVGTGAGTGSALGGSSAPGGAAAPGAPAGGVPAEGMPVEGV
jgi:phage shock protein A